LPAQFLQASSSDANQIGVFGTTNNNDEISKAISKKRKFGELFGLGRKILVDVIEDSDDDTYCEVLEFFQSIRQKRQRKGIDSNNGSNSNDTIMEIRNPIARIQKGRPKSKRTKGILEESNTNKTQYKCKVCKKIGHNSKTCKGKEN